MNNLVKYSSAFGVGACAGILNELIYNKDHWCISNPNWKVLLTATVGNLYGWATVISVTFFDIASRKGMSSWGQIAVATTLVAGMEGMAGFISKKFHNGEHKWQYPKSWIPLFDGYVSIVSTLYFGIGIAAFYFLFYKPYLCK